MEYEITAPDGRRFVVTAPPGASQEDVLRYAQQNTPPPARGWAPTAIARGLGDLAGTPRDLSDLSSELQGHAVRGLESGIGALAGWLGYQPPRFADAVNERLAGVNLPTAMLLPGLSIGGGMANLPTGRQAGEAIMQAAGITPEEPQTAAGRIGASALRFAAGSAVPGGSVGRTIGNVALGAASGALSEAAGQASEGTAAEPYARVAGALAPAGVAAGVGATRGALPRQAARAIEGMTPQQVAQAMDLMAEAERLGSPITVTEALQQVAGRNRALGAVQDFAESSIGGGPEMARFMAGREAGASRTVQNTDAIMPGNIAPSMVPARVQDAANDFTRSVLAARTAAVRPLYEAATQAAQQPQAAGRVRQAVDRAATDFDALAQRDQSGLLRPVFDRIRSSFDGTHDWESIQDARRYFRDQMRQQVQPGQPVLDRKIGAQALTVLDQLTRDLRAAVPQLARADASYIRITDAVVEPVTRGQIGAIAETGSATQQRGILFPRNPSGASIPATPASTATAVGAILGKDADAMRGLLALELQEAATKALQRGGTGPRQGVGASFAADVAGNPQQRAILLSAVEKAHGAEASRGLARLLDVFEAQQFRPPSNSMTAPRQLMQEAASTGGPQSVGRAVTRPLSTAAEALERWRAAGSTEDLARMLTSREGLARLRVLARVGESGLPQMVSGLLNMQRANVAAQQ